ncbi:unnamed protein product [Cuscuta epithymum]|uniref:Uncharacterized protein n=1 Tax=Cuscuta epithymum TaxID=186058 RepID=A0AAV0GBC6_9ASTE|nr:unnamed protein product [Cuscuta epithymum]
MKGAAVAVTCRGRGRSDWPGGGGSHCRGRVTGGGLWRRRQTLVVIGERAASFAGEQVVIITGVTVAGKRQSIWAVHGVTVTGVTLTGVTEVVTGGGDASGGGAGGAVTVVGGVTLAGVTCP